MKTTMVDENNTMLVKYMIDKGAIVPLDIKKNLKLNIQVYFQVKH
jgi:hypothetical protein